MALDFPTSPALNQTYTFGSYTWRWDGTSWVGAVPIVNATINNTTIGAVTPSTGAFTSLTSTSGAFNGTVGATTPSTVAATTLAASDRFTSSTSNTFPIVANGATTGNSGFAIQNTGGTLYSGVESSTGGAIFSGATAYSGVLGTNSATSLHFATNGAVRGTFTSTGLNSTAIGATTPSTGAFTTLSATGITLSTGDFVGNSGTQILGDNGTVGAPFFSFDGDADTGAYRPTANRFGIAAGGSLIGDFSATGLAVTGALSASGTTTVGPNNTGTGLALLQLFGGSGTNGGGSVYFGTNGTAYSSIGQSSGILGGTSTDLVLFANNGSQNVRIYAGGGGNVGTFSSTGLAVTGTLSATGIASLTGTSPTLRIGNQASGGAGAILQLAPSSTQTNWLLGANQNVSGAFEITPSTAGGGTTFSTPSFIINSSGNVGIGTSSPANKLDVAGGITCTGFSQSSSANAASSITCTSSVGYAGLRLINNASTEFELGIRGSAIGAFGDLVASDGYLYKSGAIMIMANGGNVKIAGGGSTTIGTFSSSGLAVTGALSATGNISNTFAGNVAIGHTLQDTTTTSGSVFINFLKSSGGVIGSIARVTTTDAVVYNTTSDGRLKENLRDFTDSGRLIDSLKPRVFDWKNSDENGKNVIGFIAQEEHAADPIFAHIGAVSVGDEDADTITKQWQRSDSALIPILVAELKNVRQRLAALETK